MAKTILNTALGSLRGRVDGWVFRRQNGALVVTKRPDFSEVEPTAAQLAVRGRFQQAAAYGRRAMADPVLLDVYTRAAEGTYSNPYAIAVTDALKPPVIEGVDLAGYHGAIGEAIVVRARDDLEVTAVNVIVRDSVGAVLEQGAAAAVNDAWVYTATTTVALGTVLSLEAIAFDRPGNRTTQTTPHTVA
jgi:hypothetical protein